MLSTCSVLLIVFAITVASVPIVRETTDVRFLYQCIDQHNVIRQKEGLTLLLEFDSEMETLSSQRAQLMAESGMLLPSAKTTSENSAFGVGANETVTCRDVVDHWFHKSQRVKTSSKSGHVALRSDWKKISRIGCSRFMIQKPEVGSYVVCNYGLPLQ